MTFNEAMSTAETGFAAWATKPHNKKWAKRLDGTPIPNDLLVCIALEFVRRSDCGCVDAHRANCPAAFF